MSIENRMQLTFLSRSANESFARVAVAGFLAQLDPTLDELSEIKTAVSEAVTNSIVHGYADRLGLIYITAKYDAERNVTVAVRDCGCGIEDVAAARMPLYTTSPNGERAGMGFTIMESFSDRLKVWSKLGVGTRVEIKRRLDRRDV